MKRHISGKDLRDKLLSRINKLEDAAPTEADRIAALSLPRNRELLQIIATKQPRSISELAMLADRLQPNVSRSLNGLARAGLITVVVDGRVSVPTLTEVGQQKSRELGFVTELSPSAKSAQEEQAPRIFSATIVQPAEADLGSDGVQAKVEMRFPVNEGYQPITAHAVLDLNSASTNLLANWWRVLYRRGDPFKLFPIEREINGRTSPAVLFVVSTGRLELFPRSVAEDQRAWNLPCLSLTSDDFTSIVLDEFVRPVVSFLHAGRRFDRPVESLMRRTEDILANPVDLAFWRSAGAFGMSYETMSDTAAADVANLMNSISNEDARIELASALAPGKLHQTLMWVENEVAAKANANKLPRLIELRQGEAISQAAEPWRIGTRRACKAREQIGLAEDRPVGGITGLADTFGASSGFLASSAGEDVLRGFVGHADSVPFIVIKDEGPKSTAFLMSRAIGDFLVYGNREAPILDMYTDRQAVGRAFAAEFMAPARAVVRMIEEEHATLDTVAEHYGVVREVIRRQYENNAARSL